MILLHSIIYICIYVHSGGMLGVTVIVIGSGLEKGMNPTILSHYSSRAG